jgi:LPS sulfotransferase NodH
MFASGPHTVYVIAATPRTGSNLLCEGLSATGVAGVPQEYFAPDFVTMWRSRWGLDASSGPGAFVETALRHGTSSNGVTAFKIQWMHVARLAGCLGLVEAEVLPTLLPGAAFVNTVRRDRRAQALSWFRAIETREWGRLAGSPAPPAPALDVEAMVRLEAHIAWQQAAWEAYFAAAEVVPLTVEYESLDADYRGQLSRVLRFLGLDASAAEAVPAPRLARQADDVTVRWRRQLDSADDGDGGPDG